MPGARRDTVLAAPTPGPCPVSDPFGSIVIPSPASTSFSAELTEEV